MFAGSKPKSQTTVRPVGDLSTWVVAGFAPDGSAAPGTIGPPEVGSRVGPFRLTGILGSGGMGIVYRAQDERLDRTVALKVTAPGVADPDLLRREARRAAAVEHPHVATVFEVDEHDGLTYIAMELVEGESLRERLARPIPAREVWAIAAQVADVLAHAHARGLVHRDLKPENVMVRVDGAIKVLDFGLATGDAERGATIMGGTFGYMAPEQRTYGKADARSDVYAFGVLVHELCTDRRPPRAGLVVEDAEHAPRAFRELLRQCLGEKPDERLADGEALLAAVVARRPRRRTLLVAAIAVLVAAMAAIAAFALGARSSAPDAAFAALTAQGDTVPVQDADLSPDGRTVVFSERRGLVRLDVATHDTRLVSRSDTYYCVRWYPDGRHVAVHDRGGGGRLLEIDAQTGVARVLPVAEPGCAAPSPDGRWLAVETIRGYVLHEVAALADGAPAGQEGVLALSRREVGSVLSRVVWSPDGARFAVLARPARNTRDGAIYGVEVRDRSHRVLVRDPWLTGPFGLGVMEWESSTRLVYALSPRGPEQEQPTVLWRVGVEAGTGRVVEPPRPLRSLGQVSVADLRFDARREHLLAVSYTSDRDIYVGDLDLAGGRLSGVERVTFSGREERMSSWSPDGRSIWFVAETARAHEAVRQALPGYPELVAPGATWTTWPVVRADGVVLMWAIDREGGRAGEVHARLLELRGEGKAPVEVFRPGAQTGDELRGPPPVGWQVRCAARAPRCDVVHVGLDDVVVYGLGGGGGAGVHALEVAGDFVDARPSGDGERLLLVRNRAGLVVTDRGGAVVDRIAAADGCGFTGATWLPDDSGWIAAQMCLKEAVMFSLVAIDAGGSRKARTLWSAPSVMAIDLHVSPDGRRLAFTQETFANDIVMLTWERRD